MNKELEELFKLRNRRSRKIVKPSQSGKSRSRFSSGSLQSKEITAQKMNKNYGAVVKFSYKSLTKDRGVLAAHAGYIARNGAGKEGEDPILFSHDKDEISKDEFVEKTKKSLQCEKNFLKLILSPENPNVDLIDHTKKVIKYLENQHDFKLNWQAAIHQNTANPHVHLIIRGVQLKSRKPVRFRKDIIRQGMRNFAMNEINSTYGQKTTLQLLTELNKAVHSPYITKIDRTIDFKMKKNEEKSGQKSDTFGFVKIQTFNKFEFERLDHLSRIGLAKRTYPKKNQATSCFLVKRNFISQLQLTQEAIDQQKINAKRQAKRVEVQMNARA